MKTTFKMFKMLNWYSILSVGAGKSRLVFTSTDNYIIVSSDNYIITGVS